METPKSPLPAEIFKLRRSFGRINQRLKLSSMDKLAVVITEKVGSMGFFLIIFLWTFGWLGWNTIMPGNLRFDPYPAFVLWLFISNVIQICLMPLIMVGQNLLSAQADAREQADFEINKIAETEIKSIIQHLEAQDKMLKLIIEKLEKSGIKA